MQTVTSTESFNSGIHLQQKPDGNKQGCCFSNCFVSDRDPRLFLTVTVLVFITHVLSWKFPNELCQACQNCIPALLLSWRYAAASSHPPQAAKSGCGLLTSQADSHPLLQSVCNTEPQSQRQRATKKPPNLSAYTLHMAKKERSPFNLRLCGSFWGTQSIFLAPITVSWQTDNYDPNSLCKHQ